MERPSLVKESIIKDVRNKDGILRDITNIFRLEKENKAINDIILGDIRYLFQNEEEKSYYKPVRVSNSWSNNYIEYESNDNRNKAPAVGKYLNKIRPYLKDII